MALTEPLRVKDGLRLRSELDAIRTSCMQTCFSSLSGVDSMSFQFLAFGTWCTALGFLCGFAPLRAQPACGSCPFPPCPCPCTLDDIAAAIFPIANQIGPSDILSTFSSVIVRKNQVLYVYQYTSSGPNATQVTTYLPIKQFGNTGLYFYRLPQPSQPVGGWIPVYFQTASDDSTLPPYWSSYFKCNRLPYLSSSEVNQITQLFLPGCCCPPCK